MGDKKDFSDMQTFRSKYKTFQEVVEKLYLPSIIDTYSRVKILKNIKSKSENEIRNSFEYDLCQLNTIIKNYISNQTITLNSESQIITKNDLFRTDIKLFCCWYRKTFIIECKKLNGSNSATYIKGGNRAGVYEVNGIERFTTSTYGANDDFAGMIGFVVDTDCQNITDTLKTKVEKFEYHISSKKLLSTFCSTWQYSFQSKHLRAGKKEIHIYHLFFEFK